MVQAQEKKPLRILQLLSQALSLYRKNFLLFVSISFLGNILYYPQALLRAIEGQPVTFSWLYLIFNLLVVVNLFIALWAYMALVNAGAAKYQQQSINFKRSFLRARGNYLRFIFVSLCYSLVIGIGLMLFVVPGIYWGIVFSLAGVIAILDKQRQLSPFKTSKQLISGYFFKVLFAGAIVNIIFFIVQGFILELAKHSQLLTVVIAAVFNILYLPLIASFSVVVYYQLKQIKDSRVQVAAKKRKKGFGCLVAFLLLIAFIALNIFWISNIINFANTSKGARLIENIRSIVSPKIVFPGGVKLERPPKAFVLKENEPVLKYSISIYDSENQQSFYFTLYAYDFKILNLKQKDVDLSSSQLADKIFYKTFPDIFISNKQGFFEAPVKVSQSLIKIKQRPWAKAVFRIWQHRGGGQDKPYNCKLYYTIVDDYFLVVNYYQPVIPESEEAGNTARQKLQRKQQALIYRIIEDINFEAKLKQRY
jgi:hypothetical protein